LDVLTEQRTVTSDAVDKTVNEGQALLDYLRELNGKNAEESLNSTTTSTAASAAAAASFKQSYSNSLSHIEGIVQSVRGHYADVDTLLGSLRAKLEVHAQIKLFERDALEASQHLDHWSEELRYLDDTHETEEARSSEMAESWLHSQVQTANQMQAHVFELLQRGADLVQHLEATDSLSNSSSAALQLDSSSLDSSASSANQHTLNWLKQQNTLKSDSFVSASKRVQSLVEYLNEREKELHELAVRQQRKLGQTLQINQLETECNQLLAYITNVEMTLFSILKFARNLDEAEQIKKGTHYFMLLKYE
jgi:hypothetical protein